VDPRDVGWIGGADPSRAGRGSVHPPTSAQHRAPDNPECGLVSEARIR
jgi:hypothetical protein